MIKNSKIKKNHQGFSLVEMIVAMFVFVLMMMVVSSIFAVMVKTRKEAREMQMNMENIRYAMEFMAKNIRMSSIISENENKLRFYNHSQGKCMELLFDSNNYGIHLLEKIIPREDCKETTSLGTSAGVIGYFGEIRSLKNVKFYYEKFGGEYSTLGKVTISMEMEGIQESAQTTVSLRNYSVTEELSTP